MNGENLILRFVAGSIGVLALALAGCQSQPLQTAVAGPSREWSSANQLLLDGSGGADWPAYGGLYDEQHFSALDQIDTQNVGELGLVWYLDLPQTNNPATAPVAVDGVIYMSYGYSVVYAIDAVSGDVLWTYDPEAAQASGDRLKNGWGIRGVAYWDGAVYTATHDGRMIALDAQTGELRWSRQTLDPGTVSYITGAPRVFDGKVIIGFGGADVGVTRGYVTALDAQTGEHLWRFYTVPGNPANGFENDAMRMAAETWTGEFWRGGGGGTVWNAITYDPELNRIYLGTGNGNPWNQKARSPGGGDNLFLCSIIALDADTGEYIWHYQTTPAETWDYNSSMDMTLAEIEIGGEARKVILHAPKNGFLYVVDRITGQLISAEKIVPNVNWATHIDLSTGRPAAIEAARYPDGAADVYPSIMGAHNWPAQSYDPGSGLLFIPTLDMPIRYDDSARDPAAWQPAPFGERDPGVDLLPANMANARGAGLLAWDPVGQREVWYQPVPGGVSSATMATAGGLVLQGRLDGKFIAYSSSDGRPLWTYDAGTPIMAQPITFSRNGRQYITVVAGFGGGSGGWNTALGWDYRTQQRRMLTFALGKNAPLPPTVGPSRPEPLRDPDFRVDPAAVARGGAAFNSRCSICHGPQAVSGGAAPDLRASPSGLDPVIFRQIVQQGMLIPRGMPAFHEFSAQEIEDLRHYVRAQAQR